MSSQFGDVFASALSLASLPGGMAGLGGRRVRSGPKKDRTLIKMRRKQSRITRRRRPMRR